MAEDFYAGILDDVEPPPPASGKPAATPQEPPPQPNSKMSGAADTILPGAVGAVVGNLAQRYGPKPDYMTQPFQNATVSLENASDVENLTNSRLSNIENIHKGNVGQMESLHQKHLADLEPLKAAYDEARHKASMLDALDFGERKVPGASGTYNYGAVMPGDEVPHKLLTEMEDMTKGQHGQGAHDIAERNRIAANKQRALGLGDYRLSGSLEGQLFTPPVQGVTPAEQRNAKIAHDLAKSAYETHLKATTALGKELEQLRGTVPEGKREAVKKLADAELEKQKAMRALERVTDKPSFIGKAFNKLPYGKEVSDAFSTANKVMNTNPVLKHVLPTVGGGLGMMELLSGAEHLNKDEKLKGALEMMSGAGGLLGAVPHPLARGIGLGMQAPLMGYEGYNYLKDKLNK